MCFRIQELQQEVCQLQEKLAVMENGLRDCNKQVGFLFTYIVTIEVGMLWLWVEFGLYLILILSFYTAFIFFIILLIELIAGMA